MQHDLVCCHSNNKYLIFIKSFLCDKNCLKIQYFQQSICFHDNHVREMNLKQRENGWLTKVEEEMCHKELNLEILAVVWYVQTLGCKARSL